MLNATQQRPIADVFGIPAPDTATVGVFEKSEIAPKTHDDFVFIKDRLKLILAFLTQDNRGDGLLIHGPFGAGKTSLIREVLGRLNWPTAMLSWSETGDVADLVGRMAIKFGDTEFEYGPLPLAMKNGWALVINEIDRGRAGNLVALNDVLDGGCLHILETGEVIHPHPNFRIFATANSAGGGDLSGMYSGSVRKLDPAFLDRFLFLSVDYMEEQAELDLFLRRYSDHDGSLISKVVGIARETRARSSGVGAELGVPLSTRGVDRILRLGLLYGWQALDETQVRFTTLEPAFRAAYLDRLSPEDHEAVMAVIRMHFN